MPASGDYAARWKDEGLKDRENIYELMARSSYEAFRPWFSWQKFAMELGCADGVNTVRIVEDFQTTVVIDFSQEFLAMTQERLRGKNVHYVYSSVEEYDPFHQTQDFKQVDAIFALHILEHLEDPVSVLKKYKAYLGPGGRILIAVPNAQSFHRQLGVAMGLLDDVTSLNAQDRFLEHRRVYCMETLKDDLEAAGLKYSRFLGNYMKPLSAQQMNDWDPAILRGLERMGKQFSGMAADLCVVAWPPETYRR